GCVFLAGDAANATFENGLDQLVVILWVVRRVGGQRADQGFCDGADEGGAGDPGILGGKLLVLHALLNDPFENLGITAAVFQAVLIDQRINRLRNQGPGQLFAPQGASGELGQGA